MKKKFTTLAITALLSSVYADNMAYDKIQAYTDLKISSAEGAYLVAEHASCADVNLQMISTYVETQHMVQTVDEQVLLQKAVYALQDKSDKCAGGYASDTEQQKIKDYVVNEREKIAAMSRSKAKVNAMEGLNTYIGANNPKVEGGLGKLYSEIDIKNAKPLPPKKTYKAGEEVNSDNKPTAPVEPGAFWRRVGITRWRVVK